MDEPPIIQPSKKDVFLALISKNKHILIIILVLFVLIPTSIIIYTKYSGNKLQTPVTLNKPTPTPTFIPINIYLPSKDLITEGGATFFAGEVVERTNTSLTIKGDGKTIKFNVSGKIYFIEIPRVLTKTLKDYIDKKIILVDYNYIEKGNHLSVTIKTAGQLQVVTGGLFFR